MKPAHEISESLTVKERRSTYRTTEGLDRIGVSMSWRGHKPVHGTLVDLSVRGAAVLATLADEAGGGPSVGTAVYLTFEVPGIDPVSGILAVVRNMRDAASGRVIGLEIVDWRVLYDAVPAKAFSAFNRRRHYRLEFTDNSAPGVDVWVLPNTPVTVATLANLSVSGCLLLFELEAGPGVHKQLRIQFSLPGLDHRFDLQAIVKRASEFRGAACRGLEFDAARTENFAMQEELLSDYIAKRRNELEKPK